MANQRALIDVEMLIDVRHGTVSRMNPAMAEILASTEWYRFRQHDNFEKATNGEIKWEEYQKAYAERDGDTIAVSNMTNLVHELRRDIKAALPALERGVEFDAMEIYINFYPYDDLTVEEREIIVRSVQYYMPLPTKVYAEYIPWDKLTPERFERQFEMVAIYNHEDWLKHHHTALLQQRMPHNVIMTPRISPLGEDPRPDPSITDVFQARSRFFQEWISLVYLPTPWVCYNQAMFQEIHSHRYSETAPPGDPPQAPDSPQEVLPRQ